MPITAIPNNSLLYYDAGQLKKITSDNTIAITQGFTAGSLTTAGTVSGATGSFSGNVAITGNLTVGGNLITKDAYSVIVGDAFIDLLASNTSATPSAGGLTVNVVAASSAFTVATFVAGTGLAQPYVTTTATPTGIVADHIIQISGTTDGKNDGLYVVESVSGTTIYIKGNGPVDTSVQTPFVKRDFLPATSAGSLVNASVAGWAVSNGSLNSAPATPIGIGTWCYAYGANDTDFIDSWTALTAVTQSLQAAYNGGPSITLSGTNDLVVSLGLLSTAKFLIRAATGSKISAPDLNIGDDPTDNTVFVGNVKLQGAESITSSSGNNPSSLTEGAVVYRNASNDLSAADSTLQVRVIGTVGPAPLNGEVQGVYGTPVTVQYVGGAPAVGAQMYLSATAGAAQSGPPASGRIYFLGTCIVNLGGGLATIDWTPQYIADV